MVAYWHWHSLHNAVETYWKGLLSHDFLPNPTYEEAKYIGSTFKRLSENLVNLKIENKIAILVSNTALSALNSFSGNQGNLEYNNMVRLMYDALYDLNVSCDIINEDFKDFSKYKMILVPSLYAASDTLLKDLNKYVEEGGNIIYGIRTGFSNENVKVRSTPLPGIIEKVCGVTYSQFVGAKNVKLKEGILPLNNLDNNLSNMIELLTVNEAKIHYSYDHPYWGKYAAVTKNKYKKGTAIYMGCVVSKDIMKLILENELRESKLWTVDNELSYPIITKKGINQKGKKVHFYFNYQMEGTKFKYPHKDGTELLFEIEVKKDEYLEIKPWGVLIIEEK